MRNPTNFSFADRAFRVRHLRKLFQQRPPRIEREQEPDAEAVSPPSDILRLLLAQPELAI